MHKRSMEQLFFIPKSRIAAVLIIFVACLGWGGYSLFLNPSLKKEQSVLKQYHENKQFIQASKLGFLQLKKAQPGLTLKTNLKSILGEVNQPISSDDILENIIKTFNASNLHLINIKPLSRKIYDGWQEESFLLEFSGSYLKTIRWLATFLSGLFSIQKLQMEKSKNHGIQTTLQLQIYHR